MFNKLKMKIAGRRVNSTKKKTTRTKKSAKKASFWTRTWAAICRAGKWVAKQFKRLWAWIRSIDLIGLINLTLLVAIIVLFSMLIMDICRCGKKTIAVPAADVQVMSEKPADKKPAQVQTDKAQPKKDVQPTITLPVKNNVKVSCGTAPVKIVRKKPAKCNVYGDTIIDGEFPGNKLPHCAQIDGTLILQNMHRYTLPCGTNINGDLILRNVGILKFCDGFTVTGNIYVNRNSSFGPIPRNARIGGQVIL